MEDGCLVGRSLAGPWQRGVAGPQAIVAMLQLPLPPGALQPLSAALPLHVRPVQLGAALAQHTVVAYLLA